MLFDPHSPDTMQVSRKKRRGVSNYNRQLVANFLHFFSDLQIIEKRRRDRINNCLVELRRLVPAAFEKQVCGGFCKIYVSLCRCGCVFLLRF